MLSGQGSPWSGYITSDKLGNIYSTGRFSNGNVDFDPGPDTFNLSSNYFYSLFIEKLNPAGEFLWAKKLSGTNDIGGGEIMTDNLGNVYIAGGFYGTADFDPGPGTSFLTSNSSGNGPSTFILKLSTEGDFLWVLPFTDSSYIFPSHSIVTNVNDNLIVIGEFQGTHDFDPGPAILNLNALDGKLFISKYAPGGSVTWVKQFGNQSVFSSNVAIDSTGNILIGGSFSDTSDFDPGPGVFNLVSSGPQNAYTLKLDPNGNFLWVKQLVVNYSQSCGNCITTDPAGNIIRNGVFHDTVDFDPGPGVYNLYGGIGYHRYILKLSHNGDFAWAKQIDQNVDCIYDLTTDSEGNNYFVGTFQTICDIDPSESVYSLNAINGKTFILKLSPEGCFLWARQLKNGSTRSIYGDCHNNLFLTGMMDSQMDFDPDTSSFYLPGNNHCSYLLKWNQCAPKANNIIAESCNSYSLNTYSYSTSGNYIQFLTSAEGCDSLLTINLTINTIDTSVIQSGNSLMATDTNMSYQWVDCDNGFTPIPGETNQIFIPTIPGIYALIGSYDNCSDTSSCYAITTVGIEENVTPYRIMLFPNPTSGMYSINPGNGCEELDLEVRDVLGRLLEARHLQRVEFNDLRLEGPKGVYYVTLKTGNTIVTIKLLK